MGRVKIFAVLSLTACLVGCKEDLASRDHNEMPFSLYGVISPDLRTQSIRVYLVEDFPPATYAEILDVTVTSVDLDTGIQWTWQDSLVAETGGLHEHVFWAPFRAEYGHRYRIEARRDADGSSSWVEVRVPPKVAVYLNDDDANALQVFIEGEDIQLHKPVVDYAVSPVGGYQLRIPVNHDRKKTPVEGGWNVVVDLAGNRYYVQGQYAAITQAPIGIRCSVLRLHEMVFEAIIGDAVWDPPGGAFDPDILSLPGVMDNVENGIGFVGGGYRINELLFPSREAVEDACFIYDW